MCFYVAQFSRPAVDASRPLTLIVSTRIITDGPTHWYEENEVLSYCYFRWYGCYY